MRTHPTLKPLAVVASHMPVSGYDPEDIDDMLESRLTDDEKAQFLTDAEWEAYQRGDESLVDLLSSSEIKRIFDRRDVAASEE